MKTLNPKQIDQQIAALQRQRDTLEKLGKLQEQREILDRQMREVAKGIKGVKISNISVGSTREFPRGIITYAATKELLSNKGGATIDEIVNGILANKAKYQIDESVTAADLKAKVRNLLNSSDRFVPVKKGSGVYKMAPHKQPTGALFQRLAKQAEAVAAWK